MTEDESIEHARSQLRAFGLPHTDMDLARFYFQLWIDQCAETQRVREQLVTEKRGGYHRGRVNGTETQSPVAGALRRDVDSDPA